MDAFDDFELLEKADQRIIKQNGLEFEDSCWSYESCKKLVSYYSDTELRMALRLIEEDYFTTEYYLAVREEPNRRVKEFEEIVLGYVPTQDG